MIFKLYSIQPKAQHFSILVQLSVNPALAWILWLCVSSIPIRFKSGFLWQGLSNCNKGDADNQSSKLPSLANSETEAQKKDFSLESRGEKSHPLCALAAIHFWICPDLDIDASWYDSGVILTFWNISDYLVLMDFCSHAVSQTDTHHPDLPGP